MHLTDDPTDLRKWAFPGEARVDSGEFLVVFASGSNLRSAELDERGYFHTNFRLSSDGEFLALTDREGNITHQYAPRFPANSGATFGVPMRRETLVAAQTPFEYLIPLDSPITANAALFLVAFSACASPTNQIHQWAHRERVPLPVRWLQRMRLILSPKDHALHHRHPHVTRYCISSGICNPLLDFVYFFPTLEWMISKLTGAQPRYDEENTRSQVGGASISDEG